MFYLHTIIDVNSGKTVRLIRTNGALSSVETVRVCLFPQRSAAGEKGVPTAAGGRRESPSPESGLLGAGPAGS